MDTYQPTDYFQTTWDGADEHNLTVAAGVVMGLPLFVLGILFIVSWYRKKTT